MTSIYKWLQLWHAKQKQSMPLHGALRLEADKAAQASIAKPYPMTHIPQKLHVQHVLLYGTIL